MIFCSIDIELLNKLTKVFLIICHDDDSWLGNSSNYLIKYILLLFFIIVSKIHDLQASKFIIFKEPKYNSKKYWWILKEAQTTLIECIKIPTGLKGKKNSKPIKIKELPNPLKISKPLILQLIPISIVFLSKKLDTSI